MTISGGAVDAHDCGNGRVVAGAKTTMSKQTSVLAPMAVAAVTTAIVRRLLPNRQRIAVLSSELRRESSDDSTEAT